MLLTVSQYSNLGSLSYNCLRHKNISDSVSLFSPGLGTILLQIICFYDVVKTTQHRCDLISVALTSVWSSELNHFRIKASPCCPGSKGLKERPAGNLIKIQNFIEIPRGSTPGRNFKLLQGSHLEFWGNWAEMLKGIGHWWAKLVTPSQSQYFTKISTLETGT